MNTIGCFWIALLEVLLVAAVVALWRYQKVERAEDQKRRAWLEWVRQYGTVQEKLLLMPYEQQQNQQALSALMALILLSK